ncbi:MAG: hypothetical protein H0U99_00950 [Chthoniobacterales bacterium]|nr:hypothetical protein [Chthoniobacterales bacterium]
MSDASTRLPEPRGGDARSEVGRGRDFDKWQRRIQALKAMSTVEEIKTAIDRLSPRERCELNALLHDWPDDEWDKQMRADAEPGGKLNKLMLEAEADAKAGRLREFPSPGEK